MSWAFGLRGRRRMVVSSGVPVVYGLGLLNSRSIASAYWAATGGVIFILVRRRTFLATS